MGLSRVKNGRVLAEAVQDGVGLVTWDKDSFAYADNWDEAANRYRGLRAAQLITVNADGQGIIVKPEAAIKQFDAEKAVITPEQTTHSTQQHGRVNANLFEETDSTDAVTPIATAAPAPRKSRRFHGSVQLDATRMGRDASTINMEVVQHLVSLMGANAKITLEIQVDVASGVPDNVVRTVMENCRTLKFSSQEFEDE